MAYIPLRKAVEFLGLHPNTLRRYADEGKIKSIKNPAGQRLYDVESYIRGDSIRTPNTLRRYADEGKIKSIKNPAGQRLYDVESYIRGDSSGN
jgi:DNA-binding transcriptional MerR regulator